MDSEVRESMVNERQHNTIEMTVGSFRRQPEHKYHNTEIPICETSEIELIFTFGSPQLVCIIVASNNGPISDVRSCMLVYCVAKLE